MLRFSTTTGGVWNVGWGVWYLPRRTAKATTKAVTTKTATTSLSDTSCSVSGSEGRSHVRSDGGLLLGRGRRVSRGPAHLSGTSEVRGESWSTCSGEWRRLSGVVCRMIRNVSFEPRGWSWSRGVGYVR